MVRQSSVVNLVALCFSSLGDGRSTGTIALSLFSSSRRIQRTRTLVATTEERTPPELDSNECRREAALSRDSTGRGGGGVKKSSSSSETERWRRAEFQPAALCNARRGLANGDAARRRGDHNGGAHGVPVDPTLSPGALVLNS